MQHSALAVDDPQAKAEAADLISRLGFDTASGPAGPLAESWRFEPETAAYALPYFIDPDAVTAFWAHVGEALRSGTPPPPTRAPRCPPRGCAPSSPTLPASSPPTA
ncbi:hypothetical protein [Streptomyces caniscabiei]|uniref:Uncharacterized protein n=1 Tax=Streptomyces caniscabiei TaxID=2746961 RepID=A0A927L4G2_9ACTN|nr:hypothetical protein [Streptomyces caniscabiei]MBD9724848.1 hypothetical protein [Streptomyces caniscabiei]MDX3510581.1 hypothetical protein [Streptomyces caniscabiei]MDX3720664.1 hypothetical protein [Streptomyces caniscabiei]WEO26057.1 hypothetical protein IHE65_24415 [Streptomyces caniscabiei]